MIIADPTTYLLILDNVNRKIGCPMPYGEFIKNEKNNPKGSNIIFQKKDDQETDEDEDIFEQTKKLTQKMKTKGNFKNKNPSLSDNSVSKMSNSNKNSSIGNRN